MKEVRVREKSRRKDPLTIAATAQRRETFEDQTRVIDCNIRNKTRMNENNKKRSTTNLQEG
jgi:hypothetical protein